MYLRPVASVRRALPLLARLHLAASLNGGVVCAEVRAAASDVAVCQQTVGNYMLLYSQPLLCLVFIATLALVIFLIQPHLLL